MSMIIEGQIVCDAGGCSRSVRCRVELGEGKLRDKKVYGEIGWKYVPPYEEGWSEQYYCPKHSAEYEFGIQIPVEHAKPFS